MSHLIETGYGGSARLGDSQSRERKAYSSMTLCRSMTQRLVLRVSGQCCRHRLGESTVDGKALKYLRNVMKASVLRDLEVCQQRKSTSYVMTFRSFLLIAYYFLIRYSESAGGQNCRLAAKWVGHRAMLRPFLGSQRAISPPITIRCPAS